MKRRPYSPQRARREAERLAWLAQGLADSGSRAEDAYWEAELAGQIAALMKSGQEDAFGQAMDRLREAHPRAYEELADLIEAATEGGHADTPEGGWQVLLLAIPVLVWSRFAIPTRAIPGTALASLRAQLSGHVLAADVRLALADYLFSPDQLPQGYVATRRFAEPFWDAALAGRDMAVTGTSLPESAQYISDVRYVLGAVAVPPGRPVFRWNEPDGSRDTALARWREQAGPTLQGLLPGCAIEPVLPDAYFAAWRRSDREGRPHSLKAAVAYLDAVLDVRPAGLRAVVAPYHDRWLVEWRIGFTLADGQDVVHGVTWPLLGNEDEGSDIAGEITQVLEAAGVGEVMVLDQPLPLDYCEDCGAPLFPNPEGESVHAELPEQATSQAPMHLH